MAVDEPHLRSILNGFTGAEMEFLSEDENVYVIPSFSQDPIPLLSTVQPIGPFRPPLPTQVPLWMAVALKKQKRATIMLPEWMRLDNLTEWRDQEKATDAFIKPPIPAYIEVSRVLFHYAREDMGSAAEVKQLEERLGDIQDIRQSKIKKGLDMIHDQSSFIKLNNMSTMELNTIRSFYSIALSKFQRLHASTEDTLSASQMSQNDSGGNQQRAAQPADEAQRRAIRQTAQANFAQQQQQYGAAAASSSGAASSSQMPASQQQQQQQQEPEQARKLRRFQK